MMEAMRQTVDEGRRVAQSSGKLAEAPEGDVLCGKNYNHKMYQNENKYTAQRTQSNINKCQREGRAILF